MDSESQNVLFQLGPIQIGLISNALFALAIFILKWSGKFSYSHIFLRRFTSSEDMLRKGKLLLWSIGTTLISLPILYFILHSHGFELGVFLFSGFIPIIYVVVLVVSYVRDAHAYFSRSLYVGINNIDKEIETGVDYEKSLNSCKRRVRFLGIGAHKLITCEAFENTIKTCSETPNEANEFIICDPQAKALSVMEKRNNQNAGIYKQKILETLRKLKHLKEDLDFNIKVFFYSPDKIEDLPVFRLFFIDGDSVLASYYQIDKQNNDGRKLPQIQFNPAKSDYQAASFYFAFEKYYSNIKNQSMECTDIESKIREVEIN